MRNLPWPHTTTSNLKRAIYGVYPYTSGANITPCLDGFESRFDHRNHLGGGVERALKTLRSAGPFINRYLRVHTVMRGPVGEDMGRVTHTGAWSVPRTPESGFTEIDTGPAASRLGIESPVRVHHYEGERHEVGTDPHSWFRFGTWLETEDAGEFFIGVTFAGVAENRNHTLSWEMTSGVCAEKPVILGATHGQEESVGFFLASQMGAVVHTGEYPHYQRSSGMVLGAEAAHTFQHSPVISGRFSGSKSPAAITLIGPDVADVCQITCSYVDLNAEGGEYTLRFNGPFKKGMVTPYAYYADVERP